MRLAAVIAGCHPQDGTCPGVQLGVGACIMGDDALLPSVWPTVLADEVTWPEWRLSGCAVHYIKSTPPGSGTPLFATGKWWMC